MLQLEIPDVPDSEYYDERIGEFVTRKGCKGQTIQLEHSLISVSKWESKWHKPFLSNKEKTEKETIDYIRCMTLTQNVRPELYDNITYAQLKKVTDYIDDPMTATTFRDNKKGGPSRRQIITAEIIYYWMVSLDIPFECQKWHLNRLLTLIRVCNEKEMPSKKMGKKDIMKSNAALNAARRAKMGSRG